MKEYQLNQDILDNLNRDNLMPALNFGITNFDSLGSSFLTIFQCSTIEGWFKIMEIA